jgi:hypothetical protein
MRAVNSGGYTSGARTNFRIETRWPPTEKYDAFREVSVESFGPLARFGEENVQLSAHVAWQRML